MRTDYWLRPRNNGVVCSPNSVRHLFVVSWTLGSVIVVAYVEANHRCMYLVRAFAVLWKPEDPPPDGFLTRSWIEHLLQRGSYHSLFLQPATFQVSRGIKRFELVLSQAELKQPLHDKCLDRLRYYLGLVAVDPDHINHQYALGCLRRILPSSETVFLSAAQAYRRLVQKAGRSHQEDPPEHRDAAPAQGAGGGKPQLNKSVTS